MKPDYMKPEQYQHMLVRSHQGLSALQIAEFCFRDMLPYVKHEWKYRINNMLASMATVQTLLRRVDEETEEQLYQASSIRLRILAVLMTLSHDELEETLAKIIAEINEKDHRAGRLPGEETAAQQQAEGEPERVESLPVAGAVDGLAAGELQSNSDERGPEMA